MMQPPVTEGYEAEPRGNREPQLAEQPRSDRLPKSDASPMKRRAWDCCGRYRLRIE
jgi:hypothetical protein